MKETTAQQRMDLLKEIADTAQGTLNEWMRHWQDDDQDIRLRWQTDGTAVVELDGEEVMSVRVAVDVSAVQYVDLVNKPTGFVSPRPWGRIPAGWFVRTPKGAWIEVLATRRDGCNQLVTLDLGGGRRSTFGYDPEAVQSVRRGTHADAVMDEAMDALGDMSILKDEPPFDGPYVARTDA